MARNRIKPQGGFELTAWYFMRISGLVLVFLALGHLFIMHIANNVENINYAFVAGRWANPRTGWIWRLWDMSMIALAMLHGFNGLRQVLDEYVHGAKARVAVHTTLWMVMTTLLLMGSYAIWMFQVDKAYVDQYRALNPAAASASAAR
ncbi:MAG: succinate dehydrogenase hydrophobic membrane anchor subunit [Planctomycetota bacterium]|nr:succinate dehydrogenase hydrophobic membrane anchor subunit [Planctomycetota bacterium]